MMQKKRNKLYLIFTLLSLILGIIFSIIIPLFQIPDEETHFNYIYSYFDDDINFCEKINNYGDTERIIYNSDEKVNVDKYFDLSKKIDVIDKIEYVDYHFIKHFPQTIGLLVSELFHFPIIIAITFSEVLAVIFYTVICLFALKLMPIKKESMMFIMLLPMAVQQMGSFSYDVLVNSMMFLFISYILYLKYEKKDVTIKEIVKLLLILCVIAIIKIPYIVIGFLILLIPRRKLSFNKKINKFFKIVKNNKVYLFVIGIFILLLLLFLFKYLLRCFYFKVLLAFILRPFDGIKLIIRSIISHGKFYLAGLLGYFGWLEVTYPIPMYLFIIISAIIISILNNNDDYNNKKISKIDKVFLLGLFIFISLILIISMYDYTLLYNKLDTTYFTINDYINYFSKTSAIVGVQGRYFIPIMPLLLIPFDLSIKMKNSERILVIYQICYYVITFGYTILLLFNRYWE